MTEEVKAKEPIDSDAVFGSYCRTCSVQSSFYQGAAYEYAEAYRVDPFNGLWTVQLVTVRLANNEDGKVTPQTAESKGRGDKIGFKDAIGILANMENFWLDPGQSFSITGKTADEMGMDHYRAFAEREGFIFDEVGNPHKRYHEKALPADASFKQEDIDRANAHVKTILNQTAHPSPFSREGFLTGMFVLAAGNGTPESMARQAKFMKEMDSFVSHLIDTRSCLETYISEYRQLDRGRLIEKAESLLEGTYSGPLKNLAAQDFDVKPYTEMVEELKVSVGIIHAKGLLNLRVHPNLNAERTLEQYQAKCNEVEKAYKKTGADKDSLARLKAELARGGEPFISPSMIAFIDNYKERRTEIEKTIKAGKPLNTKQFMPPTR